MLLKNEIYLFCVLIIFILWFKSKNDKLFSWVCLSSMVLFTMSVILELLSLDRNYVTEIVAKIILAIYFAISSLPSLFWCLHVLKMQNSSLLQRSSTILLLILPSILLAILSIASLKWNLVFYFDNSIMYHRGPFYSIHIIISYGYLVLISIKSIVRAFNKNYFSKRQENLTFASFVIFPIIFGLLQVAFYGVPLYCIGITLSLVLIFINLQSLNISIDFLTKINNRNSMISYLGSRLNRSDFSDHLILYVIDIDKFKYINDTFGHSEGDAVLVAVANALKNTAALNNSFVSRYGGDEFIVISEIPNKNYAQILCDCMYDEIRKINKKMNKPYSIEISIGYAIFNNLIKTIPEFISAADAKMYEVKNSHHSKKK